MNKSHIIFFIALLGAFFNYYSSSYLFFWGWSEIAHFCGGIFISYLVYSRWRECDPTSFNQSKVRTKFFIVTAGAIWWLTFWEILEYAFFYFNEVNIEVYNDTMRDLMMDFLGSFIASYFLAKKK